MEVILVPYILFIDVHILPFEAYLIWMPSLGIYSFRHSSLKLVIMYVSPYEINIRLYNFFGQGKQKYTNSIY